ncbi:GntR family transcriptional regulator [Halotalea alkalilenta]|uniref:GntR family transcriptional regulator n=1 Tax=Halotalea alkalilenta TaxID=376489 RepID=UPI000483459B|nr:GntR family transcriptional regulator [Halotalea alkalilenta]
MAGNNEDFSLKTVASELHRKLRLRMCEGEFAPGEAISIRRIAAEYGTSMMPAREAVRWMVAEGALEFADSRKIIVPTHSRQRFYEILYARKSLETQISRQSFPHIEREDIRHLEELDDRIDESIESGDLSSYMRGNYQFHFHIYRLSGSKVLLPLVELLWMQYGPSMRFIASRWRSSRIADDYHQRIIRALDEGDREAFCDAIAADIEQGIELLTRQTHAGVSAQ